MKAQYGRGENSPTAAPCYKTTLIIAERQLAVAAKRRPNLQNATPDERLQPAPHDALTTGTRNKTACFDDNLNVLRKVEEGTVEPMPILSTLQARTTF